MNIKKIIFSLIGVLILVGFYFNMSKLTTLSSIGFKIRSPFSYFADTYTVSSKYKIFKAASDIPTNWNSIDLNDSQWNSATLGRSALKTLNGFENKPGIVLHRLRLSIPNELIQLNRPMALYIPYVCFSHYEVYINGRKINEEEGCKFPFTVALVAFNKTDLIGSTNEILFTIKGDFLPSDTGISYYIKTIFGVKSIFQNIYTIDERTSNSLYNIILVFKAGFLLLFIILFLVTKFQHFMIYFLIYATSNTIATFFIILRTAEILSINSRAFWMFNLQLIGYSALWYFIEFLYEKKYKWYKYLLALQIIILNVLIIAFWFGLYQVDLRLLFKFHYICLTGILSAIAIISVLNYWQKPNKMIANMPNQYLVLTFSSILLIHIWSHYFAPELSNNSHQIVDILFFVVVGFIAASEFLLNQLKVLDLKNRLSSQQTEVELGKSAARIAHDIRKPFSNLKIAYSAIQSHKFEAKFTEKILSEAMATLDYGENLAQQILLSKKNEIYQLKPCDPSQILEMFLSLENENLIKKQINFQFKNLSKNPFLGESTMVLSVIQNIVNNAVEAFESQNDKKIECLFEDYQDSVGNWKCRLSILNNGPLIPKNVLNKLFKQSVTYGKTNGTGLGLSGVKNLIDKMNASISVFNLTNKRGVSFEISFISVDQSKKLDSDVKKEKIINESNESVDSKLIFNLDNINKIVVVDDDLLIHMAWQLAWDKNDLLLFESPESFFAKIKDDPLLINQIDLLVTDLYFDKKSSTSGIDFNKKLKELNFHKTILCSGASSELDSFKADFLKIIDKQVLTKSDILKLFNEGV